MPLTLGENSYLTVADADTYFADRLNSETWESASESNKSKALIMATKKIDSQPISGIKADPNQKLEFPRAFYVGLARRRTTTILEGSYYRCGWMPEPEVSKDVKDAVCEEAIALLSQTSSDRERENLQRQGVTSFSLGSLSESYSGSVSVGNKIISPVAFQLLSRYIGGSRVIG